MTKKSSQPKNTVQAIDELIFTAKQASAAYEHQQAIDLLTQALESLDASGQPDPAKKYDLLKLRAESWQYEAGTQEQIADYREMLVLAEGLQDASLQVKAANGLVSGLLSQGESHEAGAIGEKIYQLIVETGQSNLMANALMIVAWCDFIGGKYETAERQALLALDGFHKAGDVTEEMSCLLRLSQIYIRTGRYEFAVQAIRESLRLAREHGDRIREGYALNQLGIALTDLVEKRDSYEQALEIWQETRNIRGKLMVLNNLSLVYDRLGLYETAREYAEQVLSIDRTRGNNLDIGYDLESLGRSYLGLNRLDEAFGVFEESQQICEQIEDYFAASLCALGIARVALQRNQPQAARRAIQKGLGYPGEEGANPNLAILFAWLGAADLAAGDLEAAVAASGRASRMLEDAGTIIGEYPVCHIHWWRYQALKARYELNGNPDDRTLAKHVLREAHETMIGDIATLSDAGLRRNYLNKVAINRQIVMEYAGMMAERGQALAGQAVWQGSIQAPLQRMLAIGVRMNEPRQVDELLEFIQAQIIELTGAERLLVVLTDSHGQRNPAVAVGFTVADQLRAVDDYHALLEDLEARPRALLEQLPDGTSRMALPLRARGHSLGAIVVECAAVFGPFSDMDRDLLSAFANQTASALENARLYHGLEQRVAERTAELQQRNAELEVINSIQQGVAGKLDFQAIVDLVGDKLREVLDTGEIGIRWYNAQTKMIHSLYEFEHGQRIYIDPMPAASSGVWSEIYVTRQPIVLNTWEMYERYGIQTVPGTDTSKSILSVPIIGSDQVIGFLLMEDYQKEDAYSESDIRLLQTVAASMGVALENARLFDETQRLLKETEQRNAELAVINSIQQGVSGKLDFQGIIDLVGDKLREVLNTGDIGIRWYDPQANLMHYMYEYEHGFRISIEPMPPVEMGPWPRMVESRQPVLFNSQAEAEAYGLRTVPGTDTSKTILNVPIIGSDRVIGSIILENYEREHAYTDADVRLLQTVAASMGVALENARLFEETQRLLKETEQRNAELAVINSIQQGVSGKLDFQGIIDLVGDKLREVLDTESIGIQWYDSATNMIHYLYEYEFGERLSIEPQPLRDGGFWPELIETRQPIVMNSREDMDRYGVKTAPGTQQSKAMISVPIVGSDRVIGSIDLENYQKENAFSESDIRMLQTVASSMGVALENARLFDETQRLLKETEQRNAELAVINSIQQGVAGKLEFPGDSRPGWR